MYLQISVLDSLVLNHIKKKAMILAKVISLTQSDRFTEVYFV